MKSDRSESDFGGPKLVIDDLSKSERETLKAIYRHTQDQPEAHTGDLAETLGVTPGTVTAAVKRLADRASGRPPALPRGALHPRRSAAGRGRHPPPPHRRALPGRHARLPLERGRPAGPDLRARPARRGHRPALRGPQPADDLPPRLPDPGARAGRDPGPAARSTTSRPATSPRWPCPARPIPRSCASSTGSACDPASRSRSARSTRSTGRSCCGSAATTAPSASAWPARSSCNASAGMTSRTDEHHDDGDDAVEHQGGTSTYDQPVGSRGGLPGLHPGQHRVGLARLLRRGGGPRPDPRASS